MHIAEKEPESQPDLPVYIRHLCSTQLYQKKSGCECSTDCEPVERCRPDLAVHLGQQAFTISNRKAVGVSSLSVFSHQPRDISLVLQHISDTYAACLCH